MNRQTISRWAYMTVMERGPMTLADLRLAVPGLSGTIVRSSLRLEVVDGMVQLRRRTTAEMIALVSAAVWRLGGRCSAVEVATLAGLHPYVAEFALTWAARESFVKRLGNAWVHPLFVEATP